MVKPNDINIRISQFIFILVIGFVILFYFLAFEGLLLSDDVSYAAYAFQVQEGTFQVSSDIFSHRWGVIFPTSFFYSLFGVTDYSTTVWVLICFLATAWLLFNYSSALPFVSLSAVAIASFNFYPLFFSNKLFPDVVVAFFAFASLVMLYEARKEMSKIATVLFAFVFVVCFWLGFVSKETMILLIPFYLLVFVGDVVQKRNFSFWIWTVGFTLGTAFLYFAYYDHFTGDYLYRFHSIQEGHYISGHSYFDKPVSSVFKRILYQPLLMLLSCEMFIPFVLAFPVLRNVRFKNFLSPDSSEIFFGTAALFILAMLWFGSTSYLFYNPVSLNPRMFILLIPPLSVPAGYGFYKAVNDKKESARCAFLFGLGAAGTFAMHGLNVAAIYLLLTLFFLFLHFSKPSVWLSPLVVYSGLSAILVIHPVYVISKADRKNFQQQKQMIHENLSSSVNGNILVITDPLIKGSHAYFYKFRPDTAYEYITYLQVDSRKNNSYDKIYALVNPKNLKELMETGYAVPSFFRHPPEEWRLIDKRGEISLFEVPQGKLK